MFAIMNLCEEIGKINGILNDILQQTSIHFHFATLFYRLTKIVVHIARAEYVYNRRRFKFHSSNLTLVIYPK